MTEKCKDLVIIGAGPAALTAAVYSTRENIDTVLYEKGAVGGLVATIDKIDNYPGFSEGVGGMDLADELEKQAKRFGAEIEYGEVTDVEVDGDLKKITIDGQTICAKSVLVASGCGHKKAGVDGELEFAGRGVHYCATCDGAFYRDKKIVVIGGANSAIQEAMYLTKFASTVTILVRNKMTASEILIGELEKFVKSGKIIVHLKSPVTEIIGENGHVTTVNFNEDGFAASVDADGVFVFIGFNPNVEFLKNSGVEFDDLGFVKTDAKLETKVPGIFACGDVRSGSTRQVASAVGEGATAAISISEYLRVLEK